MMVTLHRARLAAGADCFGTDRAGMTGRHLLEGVKTKIEKWQEPPPAKQVLILSYTFLVPFFLVECPMGCRVNVAEICDWE